MRAFRWFCAFWVLLVSLNVSALQSDDTSDDEFGFGDDTEFTDPPTSVTATVANALSPWSLTGLARSDQGLWIERFTTAPGPALPGGNDNPLAKARQSLGLTLDYKRGALRARLSGHGEFDLAYLVNANQYDQATKRVYRQLLQLREAWVNASWGDFELHLGRQIVAWGEGDGASVLDVVNPRDLREPGLADLDDIRVPALMSRLSWFHTTNQGDHRVEFLVVHETCNGLWSENCFGLRTPPMGPFSPLPALFGGEASGPINVLKLLEGKELRFGHDRREMSWSNQQPMMRWSYKGRGIDLGVYAASVLDQQGVIGPIDPTAFIGADDDELAIALQHNRFELIGTSGAATLGDFLLKWELAYARNKPFNVQLSTIATNVAIERSDTVETLLSVSWRGLSNTMVGVEIMKIWLVNSMDGLLFPADATTWSLRVSHDALQERLHLSAVALGVGLRAQYGWLARADLRYELIDAMSAGISYVHYEPGQEFGPFSGFEHHDRVTFQMRYAFSLL